MSSLHMYRDLSLMNEFNLSKFHMYEIQAYDM